MAIKYLDSKRIRGLGLKDGIKKMNGNTANANAGTSYLVYKQITDLSEGDVVSAALIDILTASDSEMAVGLYSDSSNQPDQLLYNGVLTPTTTSSGGTLNLTNGGSTVLSTISVGTTSDTKWVLRFKANFATWATNSYFHVCLSDNDNPITSSQDELGVLYRNDSSSNNFGVHTVADANPNSVNSQDQEVWSTSTGTDYYFEIIRTSATASTVNRYTDSTYSTIAEDSSGTVSASCSGLDRIKIMANNATNTTGAVTISDIKFYNDTTTTKSGKCIGKLSDISAGQGQVSYTTLKVPLDATYTIPSGVTKIWVAAFPKDSMNFRCTVSSSAYSSSVFHTSSPSPATLSDDWTDYSPYGTWVMKDDALISGNGQNDLRMGVEINAGIVDEKATFIKANVGTATWSSLASSVMPSVESSVTTPSNLGDDYWSFDHSDTDGIPPSGEAERMGVNANILGAEDSSGVTVSCWIYPTRAFSTRQQGLITGTGIPDGNKLEVQFQSNGNIACGFEDTDGGAITVTSAAHGMSLNTWYNLIVTVENATSTTDAKLSVYINNVLKCSPNDKTWNGKVPQGRTWGIGNTANNNEQWYGKIMEFATWNKALSSSERAELNVSNGALANTVATDNLVSYYAGGGFTNDLGASRCDLAENTIFEDITARKPFFLQDNKWRYGSVKEAYTAGGYTGSSYINLTWLYNGDTWSAGANYSESGKGIFGASFGGNNKILAGGGGSSGGHTHATFKHDGTSWSSAGSWSSARPLNECRGGAGDSDGAVFVGGKKSGNQDSNWTNKYNGTSWSFFNEPPQSIRNGGYGGHEYGGIYAAGYNQSGRSMSFDGYNFANITNCPITGHAGTVGADSKDNGVYRQGEDFSQWNGSSWATLSNGLADSGMDSGGGGGTPDAMIMIGAPAATNPVEIWNGTTWSVGNEPTATYDAPSSNATVGA